MKSRLSKLLILTLVFTMLTPLFALAETQSSGEYLKDLGVIQGDGTSLMEDQEWKRQDLAVILSRLLGVEDEAKATAKSHTYADVTNSFYDGYLSWALENGYMEGYSATQFGLGDAVTQQQFAAVMLRALGYDTTGANYALVPDYATDLGLVAEGADWAEAAVRGVYYDVIVNTLGAEVKGEGQTLGAKLGLPGYELALAVTSVDAIGAKKLQVTFNKAVENFDAASVTVKKGTIAVNTDKVELSADKKSVVITTTTNLTKGEYTVSLTGLTDEGLSSNVTVDNEKVANINILSSKAPRLSGDNTKALVQYEVLNQYGEKMTETITWTVSTGKAIGNDNITDGTFEIEAASGDFVPGQVVYITGVHTATGTVVNSQVEVVLASHSDSVVFKGVYDVNEAELAALPAGFDDGDYVLLYQVKDQYGNVMSNPTFSDLVFTSNNPLFVASTFTEGSDVTIDNVTYKAVNLSKGSAVENGGTVTIQAISKFTGKTSVYTIKADALAALKTFSMSAPTKIVAEGEKVEIPFVATDQYGNAVTKFSALDGKVSLAPAYNGTHGLKFEEQNDGTAKLFYYAPAIGASDNVDLPVYLTSVVTGGNFSSLMINVKEEARPVSIIGVNSTKATSVAVNNSVNIKGEDLIIQDQYGRNLTKTQINAWLATGDILVKSTTATSSAFEILLNEASSEAATLTLGSDGDYVKLTARDTVAATESVVFELSTTSASAKSVTFTRVQQSSYTSFEVADLGTMYNDGGAATKASSDYNKTLKVYGVMANGTKVLLPASDYTVELLGSPKLDVSGNVISDVASSGYDNIDFGTGDDYKDIKVGVLVTINDAKVSGAALEIIEKDLLLSNKAPKVVTVDLIEDVVNGKAIVNPTSGNISNAVLDGFIDELTDQYGVVITEDPSITITNVSKVTGSTFAVTNNGAQASISGVKMGDKFTATYKFASGVTVKVEFTVGL